MAKGKRGKQQKDNRQRQETFRQQQEEQARSTGESESGADMSDDSRKKRQPKFGHN